MSRQSSSSQRPLTLTEELEKLEQSITLTLQGMRLLTTFAAHLLTIFMQKSTITSAKPIELLPQASFPLLNSMQNIPGASGMVPRSVVPATERKEKFTQI